MACYTAANAIITVVQEGGRMLQHGSGTFEGAYLVADCEMILSALETYRKTLPVIEDLLTNGVPLPPSGHCYLDESSTQVFKQLAEDMQRKRDYLCGKAILAQCNPVPVECLQ